MHTIYTVGHSTHTIEQFIDILKKYGIEEVVDIRTVPKSRHNPQFNLDLLADVLNKNQIGYIHIKELGGFRRPVKDSVNKGWEHPAFRGFADYMQTKEFEKGIHHLLALANTKTVVIMCAEAVPWKCHRRLISDSLLIRGIKVIEILSLTEAHPHLLTPWAHVEDLNITYPPQTLDISPKKP